MPGGNRSANRDLAAVALAAGKTAAEAATAAGVSARTVVGWRAAPEFAARVAELRAAMVSAAAGRLADGMAAAADVMRALLGSADEGVRHRAAAKLLEVGLKATELVELQRRVEELERRTAGGAP